MVGLARWGALTFVNSYFPSKHMLYFFPVGLGAKVHYSTMRPQELHAYREHEREKMEKKLNEYVHICRRLKVCSFIFSYVSLLIKIEFFLLLFSFSEARN